MKDGKGSWNLSERKPKEDTKMANMDLTWSTNEGQITVTVIVVLDPAVIKRTSEVQEWAMSSHLKMTLGICTECHISGAIHHLLYAGEI
jgi:hypothetical protein